MTWATGDSVYNDLANTIATSAISALTDSNGILHDPCEPNCGTDGSQFKGIFARNVQFLYNRAMVPAETMTVYQNFLQANADSICSNAQEGGMLGLVWSGPFGEGGVESQSSALDAIVGAACVS